MSFPLTPEGRRARVFSLIDASGDCWEWAGYRDTHGYGGVTFQGKQWKAHTLIYTLLVGGIPQGLELDHLCRNKACVNPDHLDPVTHRVNSLRSPTAMSAIWARRTHCLQGHPLDGWRSEGGYRYCLTCNRLRANANYLRRRSMA